MAVVRKLREVDGTYGASNTPCTVWVAEMTNGINWYAVEHGAMAFSTYDEIEDGFDVEEANDVDMFTVSLGMEDIEHFERLVEE